MLYNNNNNNKCIHPEYDKSMISNIKRAFFVLVLDVCDCLTELKRMMTGEDLPTPTAHSDSTIGVFVRLPLASSPHAPMLHPRWLDEN